MCFGCLRDGAAAVLMHLAVVIMLPGENLAVWVVSDNKHTDNSNQKFDNTWILNIDNKHDVLL